MYIYNYMVLNICSLKYFERCNWYVAMRSWPVFRRKSISIAARREHFTIMFCFPFGGHVPLWPHYIEMVIYVVNACLNYVSER